MDAVEARAWLDTAWAEALESGPKPPDQVMDALTGAPILSIRYAVLTQLLGKHAVHSRDALCLQKGLPESSDEDGRWDPRSFCSSVVAPWVQETSSVLGNSNDPYVNNPLRRSRLDVDTEPLKRKDLWRSLTDLLKDVQEADDPAHTELTLKRCLSSIVRRFTELQVSYPVPQRVSLEQVFKAVSELMSLKSGGEASLVVVAALLRVFGATTGYFERVDRQGINEADAATNAPGDVLCFRKDEALPTLAVEVKDRSLTLLELNATIQKSREAQVSEVLFAAASPTDAERIEIDRKIRQEWGQGTSVYHVEIADLIHAVFPLLGSDARVDFLREIGNDFDANAIQPAIRTSWSDILRRIGESRT